MVKLAPDKKESMEKEKKKVIRIYDYLVGILSAYTHTTHTYAPSVYTHTCLLILSLVYIVYWPLFSLSLSYFFDAL